MRIECQYCKKNTDKRIVVKRVPLQDITSELSEEYRKEGYKEFLCTNIISVKKKGRYGETCENHIIRKLI